jgi:hypothetical protein
MSATRSLCRRPLPLLLAVLAAAGAAATARAAPAEDAKELFPGAKLLHKFPKEVYRTPALLETPQGPRLLVWVDAFEPMFGTGDFIPPGGPKTPKEPEGELLFWDVKANKEVHKMPYPKEEIPLSPVPFGQMDGPAMYSRFGSLAFTPDGKQLASVSQTHKVVPGKPIHEATTHIRLYDTESRK